MNAREKKTIIRNLNQNLISDLNIIVKRLDIIYEPHQPILKSKKFKFVNPKKIQPSVLKNYTCGMYVGEEPEEYSKTPKDGFSRCKLPILEHKDFNCATIETLSDFSADELMEILDRHSHLFLRYGVNMVKYSKYKLTIKFDEHGNK